MEQKKNLGMKYSEEIKQKAVQIMELAVEISTTTEADVFVDYYPHIRELDVYLYESGWGSVDGNPDKDFEIVFDRPNSNVIHLLDEVIAALKELKVVTGKED